MAWSDERNRGRRERRQLHSQAATPEQVCFPHVAQIAQLYRHIGTHRPEIVWLLTSREPARLNATQWLQANRQYWGVEGGLHQRLDASLREDDCRVRNRNGVWVLGMFRRLAISLFAHWHASDPKRRHATMTDFHGSNGAEHARRAIRLVISRSPSLKDRS
jgi:predicted transposase YbfD/YdcC